MKYSRHLNAEQAERALRWAAMKKKKNVIDYISDGRIQTMPLEAAVELVNDAARIYYSFGLFDFDLAVATDDGVIYQFDAEHPDRTWDE